MDPGLDRFIIHLERLASYYKPGEEILYVKAIGLIWGGIPLDTAARAMAQMATNPGAAWDENTPLFEGTENWKPRLVDDGNPSHHYAGLLYVGFFSGAPLGHTINWLRDGPLSDPSQPDIELGRVAVDHGAMLYDYIINLEELGSAACYALDVRPAIWPKNTPGARVPWYYYFPPHPH